MKAGEALVFGRIRLVAEGTVTGTASSPYEFQPFSQDPMDHMLPPDPVMNLELRRMQTPGGPFVYKTYLQPAVQDEGSFSWILPVGDYTLTSNLRAYGSKHFDHRETKKLASFTVSRGGGTSYLGTLVVTIRISAHDFLESWAMGDTEYDIIGLRVMDQLEEELPKLRRRFPALPETHVTELMGAEELNW